MERSSGGIADNAADLMMEEVDVEDEAEGEECLRTCCLVFPTSKGVVTIAATAPEVAPAMKLSTNVAVWFSLLLERLRWRVWLLCGSNVRPRWRSRTSVRELRVAS